MNKNKEKLLGLTRPIFISLFYSLFFFGIEGILKAAPHKIANSELGLPSNGRNMVMSSDMVLWTVYPEQIEDPETETLETILKFAGSSNGGLSWDLGGPIIKDRQAYCLDGTSNEFFGWAGADPLAAGLAINSNDVLHVVYEDITGQLFITKLIDACWTKPEAILNVELDGFGLGDSAPSVALDANNQVHVAYIGQKEQNSFVYYLTLNGDTWTDQKIIHQDEVGEQTHPLIDVDGKGVPHVVWESAGQKIMLARLYPNGDQIEEVASSEFVHGPSMALGPRNQIYVSWIEEGYFDTTLPFSSRVWMAEFDETWQTTVVDEYSQVGGSQKTSDATSVAIDETGTPYILWSTYDNGLETGPIFEVYLAHKDPATKEFVINLIETNNQSDDFIFSKSYRLRYSLHHMNGGQLNWINTKTELKLEPLDLTNQLFFDSESNVSMNQIVFPVITAGPDQTINDVIGDGIVDAADFGEISKAWGQTPMDQNWNPFANFKKAPDPKRDIIDAADVSVWTAAYYSDNLAADINGYREEHVFIDLSESSGNFEKIEVYDTFNATREKVYETLKTNSSPILFLRFMVSGFGPHLLEIRGTDDQGLVTQDIVQVNLLEPVVSDLQTQASQIRALIGPQGIIVDTDPNPPTSSLPNQINTLKTLFNPKKGETGKLIFSLTIPSDVQITIYDRNGRDIRNVLSGHFLAGTHTITWDGKDQKNQTVASGTYHVVIRSDHNIQKSKLIVSR